MIFVHASGALNGFKSIPSDLTIIHYASGYQIRLWVLIRLAATLVIMSTIAVVIYQRTNAFKALRSRIIRNKPSDLTFIGLEASERQQHQWSI